MPNVIAQRIDGDGVYILATNGNEITLTTADIQGIYASESEPNRSDKATTEFKNRIVTALGSTIISSDQINATFDWANGKVTDFELT